MRARTTSRYGDVYRRAAASRRRRSSSVRTMRYGLVRGITAPFAEGTMSRHCMEVWDLNYVTVIMSESTKEAGQAFFEVQLEVGGHTGSAGFGSTDGRRTTSSSAATLGEIEKV